jgi:hypothetical protein
MTEDKQLSPAAQAVLDAYENTYIDSGLVAAIFELADQVVPSDAVEPRNSLPMAIECQRIRSEILAIATELNAHQ